MTGLLVAPHAETDPVQARSLNLTKTKPYASPYILDIGFVSMQLEPHTHTHTHTHTNKQAENATGLSEQSVYITSTSSHMIYSAPLVDILQLESD